jgi:hypothetical protein
MKLAPPNQDHDRRQAVAAALQARQQGATLRQAAAAANVHVATLCRWQKQDAELRRALAEAGRQTAEARRRPRSPRPQVRWRRDCPLCRARVVVRTARGRVPFWRCGRWPLCPWASWRPRAPRNCPRCGGPRFWSASRKSVVCDGCGLRTTRPLTGESSSGELLAQ